LVIVFVSSSSVSSVAIASFRLSFFVDISVAASS
jgi:hypothetical protein